MSIQGFQIYKDALPRLSNGISKAINPASKKMAPEIQIGTDVVKSAYSAMIGAYKYNITSCVKGREVAQAYHDPKDTISTSTDSVTSAPAVSWEQLWCHGVQDAIHDVTRKAVCAVPSQQCIRCACSGRAENEHASEDCAIVSLHIAKSMMATVLVEMNKDPRRPRYLISTMYPASKAPGTPMTLRITC